VECSINGTMVASYDKALLVTGGKLKSTDGTYGLRFAHNTDVMRQLAVSQNHRISASRSMSSPGFGTIANAATLWRDRYR